MNTIFQTLDGVDAVDTPSILDANLINEIFDIPCDGADDDNPPMSKASMLKSFDSLVVDLNKTIAAKDSGASVDAQGQFTQFIATIFDKDDIVEIRPIRENEPPQSKWVKASELLTCYDALAERNQTHNMYFGINPRPDVGLRGDDNIKLARVVFVDVDGTTDISEVNSRLNRAGLPKPSVIVMSGHGFWLYWLLTAPITDMKHWHNCEKHIIPLLGADPASSNAERIGRLPGFRNLKYADNAVAALLECSTKTYDLAAFAPPETAIAAISGENAPNTQDIAENAPELKCDPLASKVNGEVIVEKPQAVEVPKDDRQRYRQHLRVRAAEYLAATSPAIQGQGGDGHTFNTAGHLLAMECGGVRLTVDEVMTAMLAEWNNRCVPPWDASDLAVKVRSADNNGTPRAIKECKSCGNEVKYWNNETEIAEAATAIAEAMVTTEAKATTEATVTAPTEQKTYPPTNLGNGQLFADTYHDMLMYVSEWKRWLCWDGKRWGDISAEKIRRYAHKVVLEVMPQIAKRILTDDSGDRRQKYDKHIAASHQTYQLDAMLKEATAYMSVSVKELDANPMLFNLQNGTLDCKTGELKPHNRKEYITKISPCSYDPTATAPTFERFINRIMVDSNGKTDMDLVQYLQTAMGYSLTGSVREECMLVLYGNGANGKSTLLETMLYCLGDYGQAMSPSVLLDDRQGSGGEGEARLFGVRCAVAVETKEGGRLNCERIKRLTGGDKVTARRLYENSFSFDPTHKIWLATNHEPKVDGADEGIWRRLHKVPFNAVLTDAEKDTTLKGKDGKLVKEADGIMAWMIVGLRRWLAQGLKKPQAVKEATAKYREDSDVFGQFLSSCIIDDTASVRSGDLFKAYKAWADDNGITYTMIAQTMAKKLEERGFKKLPRKSDGIYWSGIGVSTPINDKSPW